MTRALIFSGWHMLPTALDAVLPIDWHVQHFDYLAQPADTIHASCQNLPPYDVIVGWSLGGQLAAHALSHGWLRASRMILVSAARRFMGEGGITPSAVTRFQRLFATRPTIARDQFAQWLVEGDANAQDIAHHIAFHTGSPHMADWLAQLAQLPQLGPHPLPPTTFIQGQEDTVVPAAQAALWQQDVPSLNTYILPGCGHAPHWHAPQQVQSLLKA